MTDSASVELITYDPGPGGAAGAAERIAARTTDGDRTPIVLCHGNSSSGRSFKHQLEGKLGERHRLIAIDLPGHGASPPAADPDGTYTLPGYATAMVEAAGRLNAMDALFVGWSLGGHILLEAADRLDEAVGFMIFGAPPVPCPPVADAFLPHPALPLAYQRHCTDDEVASFLASWLRPGSVVPSMFHEDFRRTDPRAREALAASLGSGGFRDEVDVVAGLDRPLAIVHGECDQLVNRRYLEALTVPTLWRGSVQEIPGAGHSPHWENPEEFGRMVEEFAAACVS